ncbi:MAG: hypothetical protein E6G10_21295 [Actinobacteria bacterium]|nr:MAG: hypothetical protein E6G10_21295 [Actinomycetota bacterium]
MEPQPVTLAEVARRAAEVVDPEDTDPDVADLLAQFEDADEPIGGVLEGLDERVAEAVGRVDPDGTLPAVQMMGAVITYLGYRRDEVTDVEADILRLAARAEYDGDPPAVIEEWLADQGVTL